MFVPHELHPFTRRKRLCVLMCYLCWAVLITAIFEASAAGSLIGSCYRCFFKQNNHDAEQVCGSGCENTFSVRVVLRAQEICGPGSGENEIKVSLEECESACDSILEWYVLSLIIAACTVPYSTILKILATCGCAQNMPGCCRRFFECVGSFVLAIFGCLSIIWLTMAIIISLDLDGGLFLVTYAVGVVESWLYWPFIAGAVFWWKYDKAKRKFEEQNLGQIVMAWPVNLELSDLEVNIAGDGKPAVYKSPCHSPKAVDWDARQNTVVPPRSPTGCKKESTLEFTLVTATNNSYRWRERGSERHSHEVPPLKSPYQPQRSAAVSNPRSPYVDHQHVNVIQVSMSIAEPVQGYSSDFSPSGSSTTRGLPSGWEAISLPDGRVAYLDHNQKTQWSSPHLTSPHERQPSPPSYMEHVASTAENHPLLPR